MKFQSPLAVARNHGSAGDGVGHWWAQRFSAIVLVVLTAWLIRAVFVVIGAGVDHAAVSAWMSNPINAAMAILFICASLYHGVLGVQVVIEDYVHSRWLEITSLVAIRIVAIGGAVLAVIAILSLVFGA